MASICRVSNTTAKNERGDVCACFLFRGGFVEDRDLFLALTVGSQSSRDAQLHAGCMDMCVCAPDSRTVLSFYAHTTYMQ